MVGSKSLRQRRQNFVPLFLLRIREVAVSNLSRETGYPDRFHVCFLISTSQVLALHLKLATAASFHVFSNSSFTYHPFIRRYIVWPTDKALLTTNSTIKKFSEHYCLLGCFTVELADADRRFSGTHCLHQGDEYPDDEDNKHLWIVGQFLPDHAVQRPTRQLSSQLSPWENEMSQELTVFENNASHLQHQVFTEVFPNREYAVGSEGVHSGTLKI
jgi:hypothetical protein